MFLLAMCLKGAVYWVFRVCAQPSCASAHMTGYVKPVRLGRHAILGAEIGGVLELSMQTLKPTTIHKYGSGPFSQEKKMISYMCIVDATVG